MRQAPLKHKWGMADCKPVPAPFPSKTDKLIDELALPITDVDPVMHKQYQALIGSFLYLQSQAMPQRKSAQPLHEQTRPVSHDGSQTHPAIP